MSSEDYEPDSDPEEEYDDYADFKNDQRQQEEEREAAMRTCPRCGRPITSSNPRVNRVGCQECQAGISLAGEIFLFDKKNPIVEFFKMLFGG